MNKNEFTAAVAELSGLSKADANRAVDAFTSTVAAQLKKGEEVRLVGFGTFAAQKRAASEGRNPRTGETIKIKASKQPKFKAGKELKRIVNGEAAAKKKAK